MWDKTAQDIVKKIVGTDEKKYSETDLRWKDWFSQRDKIMEVLCSEWYIRRFVPRCRIAEKIKLDDPFPPQGDMVIFLSIGRSRQNKLAEKVAGQIKEYSEKNCGKYEPALRIRSVIFHTADEYVAELEEKFGTESTNLINIPAEESDEINRQRDIVKGLKEELASVVALINREISSNKEITDEDVLNKWEDLCDICNKSVEKFNEIDLKYKHTEANILAKSKGGLL